MSGETEESAAEHQEFEAKRSAARRREARLREAIARLNAATAEVVGLVARSSSTGAGATTAAVCL